MDGVAAQSTGDHHSLAEPATGFIFAVQLPVGNPSDASYVVPLVDKVQRAIDLVQTGGRRRMYSVASDLGLNAPV